MHDQPLVDQAFQHIFAESLDAGGGEGIAADVLAVDDGHHVVLGRVDFWQCVRIFARALRGSLRRGRLRLCGVGGLRCAARAKDLGLGRVRIDVILDDDASRHDGDTAGEDQPTLLGLFTPRLRRWAMDSNRVVLPCGPWRFLRKPL